MKPNGQTCSTTRSKLFIPALAAATAMLAGLSTAAVAQDNDAEEMSFGASADADVINLRRVNPPSVRAGQPFEYTIEVVNTAGGPLYNVVIKEQTPDGLQIESAEPAVDKASEPGRQVWQIGTLKAGETRQIAVQALAEDAGNVRSCLGVDYQPALCQQLQVVAPELAIDRIIVDSEGDARETFFACEDVYAVYRVKNVGSGTTEPIQVREDFSDPLQGTAGNAAVTFTEEPLSAGETAEERVKLNVVANDGAYSGRATATTGPLTVRSAEDSVTIIKPALDLAISGPAEEFVDRPVTYNFELTNTSDAPALRTRMKLDLPDNVDRPTFSGGDFDGEMLTIGRLDAGQSHRGSVTFNAPMPGEVGLQAKADAYCAQAVEAQAATAIAGIPAVRLEVVDFTDPVSIGEETTYEIRVKNQGTAEDLNVDVTAQLPEEMSFVGGEGDTSVQADGQTVTFGRITSLPPGEMVVWYVNAQADEAGRVRLNLEMTSDATSRPVLEQEPTRLY